MLEPNTWTPPLSFYFQVDFQRLNEHFSGSFMEGQTLAALCDEIYGNSLLVGRVAKFNNLSGYRNVPAGRYKVLFRF